MRQAGRYLPEFREIRKKNPNFIELCLNPHLSEEITLQPIKRFNFDAAIIFSDILMVPYGMGQSVEFKKNLGPNLGNFTIADIQKTTENDPKKSVLGEGSDSLTQRFHYTGDPGVFAEALEDPTPL